MAALAATLLCYYEEDRAFVMLVRLWMLRGLERLYEAGFAGLMEALDDFEQNWLRGGDVATKLVSQPASTQPGLKTSSLSPPETSADYSCIDGSKYYLDCVRHAMVFNAVQLFAAISSPIARLGRIHAFRRQVLLQLAFFSL